MVITYEEVRGRMGVSEMTLDMAIYSGAIPPPDENKCWEKEHIELFLVNWEERRKRRNKT